MKQFRRPAAALIAVLVILSALTIILTVVTAQVFAQHKMVQARHDQLQADWLARAGIEWAAERLLHEPAAFTLDKTDLAPHGTVHIVVEKKGAGQFTVNADASVGAKDGPQVMRSQRARFERTQKDGNVRLVAVSE